MAKIKKLFVNHGEKIGLVLFGLIVLAGMAGADWAPYSGTPGEITTKVRSAEATWTNAKWPESEIEQFQLKPEDDPKAIVANNLTKAMPLSEVTLSQKFVRSPYETTKPITNPIFKPLEDAIATQGRVLLAVVDEDYRKEMELFQQGLDKDGKPLPQGTFPGAPKPQDDSIPDEFRKRPGAVGLPGGSPDGLSPDPLAGLSPGGDAGMAVPPGRNRRNRNNKPGAGGSNIGSGIDGLSPDPTMLSGEGGLGMPGMGMPGTGLGAGQMGRGFHYISVRAVFPVREQILNLVDATNFSEQIAAANLQILDYQIERQTKQESGDPWGGPWEPVDVTVSTDVLTKMSVGLEPDVVYPQVTDPAMTMPLPARVSGVWMKDVTHPRIEKFTLSEEQIKQEVQMQEEFLKKLEELKKELPPPPAMKKGWSDLVVNGSQLAGAMMGGDLYGGMGGGMGGFAMPGSAVSGESAGAYSDPAVAGIGGPGFGGPGFGGMPPGAPKPGAKISPIEDLIKKSDKERAKEIREYVEKVVSVVGELLLFRYIDFSVEPGKTYRYRARLVFRNPNFNRNADEAAGDTSVVTGETRTSDWSNPTEPRTVPKDQQTFVTDVRTGPQYAYPYPQLNVFQWDPTLGTVQQGVLNIPLGQTISKKQRTFVLDPANASFEEKEYQFQSTDFLVDALTDVQIQQDAHPDIKAVGGTGGGLALPEQVLVALSEGGLGVLDQSAQRADEQKAKQYHTLQNEDWKKAMEQQKTGLDPLLSGEGGGASGEGGGGYDPFGGGGRGMSPLQSRRKRGSSRPPMGGGVMP